MNRRLLPFQGWRLTFFQSIMFAVFVLFGLRMYELQISRYPEFQSYADANRFNELPIAPLRGVIYDRYDATLAGNAGAFNVTIIPAFLPDSETETLEIYNRLSALVGVPPTKAIAEAAGRTLSIEGLVEVGQGIAPFREVVIALDVPYPVALQIREEAITMPGVGVDTVAVREYPFEAVSLSHLIGYQGPIGPEEAEALIEQGYNPAFDRIGYAGLEYTLETAVNILAGERGRELLEVDVAGEVIQRLGIVPPVPGQSVRLTIDSELQRAAEQALIDRITIINATARRIVTQQGAVIAMNPTNGEILAMVSWPSYDNSRFARSIDYEYYLEVAGTEANPNPLKPLVNTAIGSLYPPGSVWKIVTAVGVLEENIIAPETPLFDPGNLVIENRYAPNDPAAAQTFFCWLRSGHAAVNMLRGIAQSCDVYFYQIGGGNPDVSPQTLRPGGLGAINLFRYATAMGIGSELGVELPGELAGRMPDPDWKRRLYGENWSTGDTYNAAFGQGYVTVTPLQLISAAATIANGGTLYQPTLIREILDSEGNVVQSFTPHVIRNLNIENIAPDQPMTLLLVEDMIMKGENSLACTCEQDSEFYNPLRCNPATYRNTVDINPDPFLTESHPYQVYIPPTYNFNASVCNRNRFDMEYTPPFASSDTLSIVQQGMRAAVTEGTAMGANLSYIHVAGKTGTAEYCDDVARPLGLCVPGNWPSHAWFTAYAPYENPEIIIIAFVYNGGEGSLVALPVVVETMEAYLRLQNERGLQLPPQNAGP